MWIVIVYMTLIGLGAVGAIYFMLKNFRIEAPPPPPIQIDVDTSAITRALADQLAHLPEQITQSITGTANTHKGKLGELIGYLQIKAEYDRIIPLGTIVDFMAIKFPTDTNPGYIDLIDIKTGQSARLSQDQRKLKELIEAKQINFKTIKIDNVEGLT